MSAIKPNLQLASPTYAANGQGEAHGVQHSGGDCAVVEGVLDAVVVTEKASLIGADLTQVKGRQRQTPCGRRDSKVRGAKNKSMAGEAKSTRTKSAEIFKSVSNQIF